MFESNTKPKFRDEQLRCTSSWRVKYQNFVGTYFSRAYLTLIAVYSAIELHFLINYIENCPRLGKVGTLDTIAVNT